MRERGQSPLKLTVIAKKTRESVKRPNSGTRCVKRKVVEDHNISSSRMGYDKASP